MSLGIRFIGASEIDLPFNTLIERLRNGFKHFESAKAPLRHHHRITQNEDSPDLLLMPAWDQSSIALKLVTLCPNNSEVGLPTMSGLVILLDARTGEAKAVLDAGELTARRTAAASALASSYLSRADAKSMTLIGTGRLASYLIEAHSSVRNIQEIRIYGRSQAKAEKIVDRLKSKVPTSVNVEVALDLASAVSNSDIVSTATSATSPIIRSSWVSAGTHLDLVGSYKKDMREVDGEIVAKSTLAVDTKSGVLSEGGDIIQAISEGWIDADHCRFELSDLCSNRFVGRASNDEITMFKSVGTAFEDLVAAQLAFERYCAIEGTRDSTN